MCLKYNNRKVLKQVAILIKFKLITNRVQYNVLISNKVKCRFKLVSCSKVPFLFVGSNTIELSKAIQLRLIFYFLDLMRHFVQTC